MKGKPFEDNGIRWKKEKKYQITKKPQVSYQYIWTMWDLEWKNLP